jgi:hypothetical protein
VTESRRSPVYVYGTGSRQMGTVVAGLLLCSPYLEELTAIFTSHSQYSNYALGMLFDGLLCRQVHSDSNS